jgi:hypothetical protein
LVWSPNPDSFCLERLKSPPTSISSTNRAILSFIPVAPGNYITYTSFHQTTVPSWVTLEIHRNSLRLRKEKEVKGRSKAKKEELRQVRLSSRRVWRRLRQA